MATKEKVKATTMSFEQLQAPGIGGIYPEMLKKGIEQLEWVLINIFLTSLGRNLLDTICTRSMRTCRGIVSILTDHNSLNIRR